VHRGSPAKVVAITREVESCVRANHTEYGLGCEHGKGGVGGMAWASGSRAKYRGGSSCKAHRCPLGSRPRLAAPRHEFWPGLVVLPKMWNRSFLTKLCGNILCKPEHRLCKWCPGSPPLPCSQPMQSLPRSLQHDGEQYGEPVRRLSTGGRDELVRSPVTSRPPTITMPSIWRTCGRPSCSSD
jgi:hypothetical protein